MRRNRTPRLRATAFTRFEFTPVDANYDSMHRQQTDFLAQTVQMLSKP